MDISMGYGRGRSEDMKDKIKNPMREIKFRGKAAASFRDLAIKEGDWIYGDLVRKGKNFWIVGEVYESNDKYISFEQWIPVEPESVGQYTGLKDKNGKEIYEGDISKNNRDFLYVITWHPSMCAFVQLQWGHTFSDGDFLDMRFNFHEIIGNIYENPELLTKE